MRIIFFMIIAALMVPFSGKAQASSEESDLGSIAGIITLPISEAKGSLYVSFFPSGQEEPPSPVDGHSFVIKAEDIKSDKVSYEIDNIPKGKYLGYVTWDTGEPFCHKPLGNGHCPAYSGDYTGVTKMDIVVSSPEAATEVDIDCIYYLNSTEVKIFE